MRRIRSLLQPSLRSPLLLLGLLAAFCAGLSGCGLVAAGAVGGAGYVAASGYTSREYVGSIERLAQVSRQGVRDMNLYVLSEDRQRDDAGETRLVLRSEFEDGTDFRITIRQKKASVALVEVWVGHLGDSGRSAKVLDAISAAYERMGQGGQQ